MDGFEAVSRSNIERMTPCFDTRTFYNYKEAGLGERSLRDRPGSS